MSTIHLSGTHVGASRISSSSRSSKGSEGSRGWTRTGNKVRMLDGRMGEYFHRDTQEGIQFEIFATHETDKAAAEQQYTQDRKSLPSKIENDIKSVHIPTRSGKERLHDLEAHIIHHNALIAEKSQELAQQNATANKFYGSNPLSKSSYDSLKIVLERGGVEKPEMIAEKRASVQAAYNAKLLEESINLLQDKANTLKQSLEAHEKRIQAGTNGRPGSKYRNGKFAYDELKEEGKLNFVDIMRTHPRLKVPTSPWLTQSRRPLRSWRASPQFAPVNS
jgi:hypothetical protein